LANRTCLTFAGKNCTVAAWLKYFSPVYISDKIKAPQWKIIWGDFKLLNFGF
jgi:hypothetical protein